MAVKVRLRDIERAKNKLERQSNWKDWKGKKTRNVKTYKKKMSSVLDIIFI